MVGEIREQQMSIEIIRADYALDRHRKDIPLLLNAYACDPMGGGEPLSDFVMQNLVEALAGLSNAFSIIAYVDGAPAGLVNCFEGFSTFACRPLINIHDVVVLTPFRGMGISRRMFAMVERMARERNCCKITLEVLSNNTIARTAYSSFGYAPYELRPETGTAMFWEKSLKE
jgi:ribosomal protein S18 acetylase RimI-like enzyme